MTHSEPSFEKDIIKKLPIVTAQNSSSDSEVRLGSSHNASSNSPHYASGFIRTTERKKGLANIDERWYYILDKWNNILDKWNNVSEIRLVYNYNGNNDMNNVWPYLGKIKLSKK